MIVNSLKIPDVKIIEPEIFEDDRGFFFESFNQNKFNDAIGKKIQFVQDNHSKSKKGVLRGLHFQEEPYAQGKLVRVIHGEVFDVAVDIRKGSATYGQFVSEILSSSNKKQLWIPEGFAHGFLTLSEEAEFLYKTTNFYNSKYEKTIIYNDSDLNINWKRFSENIVLSRKDMSGVQFKKL
jgi:dTDP-4-dehydrorhamnose 3,5-epimerase